MLETHKTGELDRMTLARAQRKEPAAQRLLVVRYERQVFVCVARLLASSATGPRRELAEDLTQETFVRVLGAVDRFDPTGTARLSTWILTIATRLALNELRRPLPALSLDETPEQRGHSERPDEAAERRSTSERVRRAIEALPADQRSVVVLREYHDLEYEEIASVLEVDLGTVKSRLSRARGALKATLSEMSV